MEIIQKLIGGGRLIALEENMSELTTIENGKVRLTLTIGAEDYLKAINAAYHRLAYKYSVPGFRKGKVPRKVIERTYGMDAFWDNEFDMLVQRTYSEALKEHELIPELQPKLVFTSVSDDDGVSFTAEVVLRPNVELGQYKGIETEKTVNNVTDEMVDAELQNRRSALARSVNVDDRPVADGDTVVIDFAGFLGDEQFEGGTAENYTLKIGSHTFIPGFEEQLVGMQIGEDRDINVTFPEDYQAENLAGKDVIFKIKLHSIAFDELPELDDAFAQDTSDFDTLDELKASIRKELEEKAEAAANNAVTDAVVKAAIDNAQVEIHDDIINAEVEDQINRFEQQLKSFGADLEGYLAYSNTTVDDLRKEYYEAAKRNLKAQYVLLSIIDAEKVEPTEADYLNAVKNSPECRQNRWDDERIEKELKDNRAQYASAALYDATINMLMDNAIIK